MRAVGPDDWQVWRRLRLAALRDAPDAFESAYEKWAHAPEERWRRRLAGSLDLVARLDGADVGMVSGMPGDPVELISLWVAPAARGRGVGDALVDGVARWADPRPVRLRVAAGNAHALALYLRHGFVVEPGGALVRVPR
ncbi:ribosomal protein S18 acetylase RimI-like enzyme [Saccharothrix australiensis]|uniref:Ribosomal protein S18 acetylase RimI-like enzyme n=1 Tax=Saccharothrix australiensis TaxID=2072 RepID=A0A495W669_9PSEU|nr:ribosomal protein S18 acetylase RimI-like enzyme [Saccharothrix australiensis]